MTCDFCLKDRCTRCGGEIFESVTDFRETLTWENGVSWICSACRHKLCPGRRLRLVSMCHVCGHKACEECFGTGDEQIRPKCCVCGPVVMAERVEEHLPSTEMLVLLSDEEGEKRRQNDENFERRE